MFNKKYIIAYFLIASSILLSACGGASKPQETAIDNISHPTFTRALVKSSVVFKPNGKIKEKSPTFEWKATKNATEYLLGHEDTTYDSRWTEYTISATEANCVTSTLCLYTPQSLQLEVGDEKVWWVKAKTSSGWQDWSTAHMFKVIADTQNQISSETISPTGVITTTTPIFKWTPGNGASEYKFGMENLDSTNWVEYTVSASQANCSPTECSFKPSDLHFSNADQKTWWIRENISGHWGNWSKGSQFLIDIKSQSRFSLIEMHYKLLNNQKMIWGELGSLPPYKSLTRIIQLTSPVKKGGKTLNIQDTTGLFKNQLMVYRATDDNYYVGQIKNIPNNYQFELTKGVQNPINAGLNAWDFYGNGSHANEYGFRAIADFALNSLNFNTSTSGKHLLLGDSWFDEGSIYNRLVEKLPNATIINEGIGGNTTQNLINRFDSDVAPQAPDYIWIISGTNDYWQGVTTAQFKINLNTLINKSKALNAKVIIIDSSVGEGTGPTGVDNKFQSEEYVRVTKELL